MNQGADGVELDVRLSKDGQVVVCHDPTLERVSGGSDRREVEQLALSELERADVGGGEHAPSLVAVLDWARQCGARVNVEVKRDVKDLSALLRRVSELISEVDDAPERVIVSSFDVRAVWWLSHALPGVGVGWLVHEGQRLLRSAPGYRWLGACAVHPAHALCTDRSVARWRRRGALVNAWTVNDPQRAVELSALGVDAVISDDPEAILRALQENRNGRDSRR